MDFDAQVATLRAAIRDVPDFPKPGIVFKDITTLLRDAVLFRRSLDLLTVLCGDLAADKVVAIESRGFILGGALARPARGGLRARAQARQAALEVAPGELRARVREGHARDPRRRAARRASACWWWTT